MRVEYRDGTGELESNASALGRLVYKAVLDNVPVLDQVVIGKIIYFSIVDKEANLFERFAVKGQWRLGQELTYFLPR